MASSRSGRYHSANAVLESTLRAALGAAQEATPDASPLDRMRAARRARHAMDRDRVAVVLAHLRVLSRSGSRSQAARLAAAAAEVARWRGGGLAAPFYIDAWQRLLDARLPAVVRALERGAHGSTPEALAANSPFAIDKRARTRPER